MADKYIIDEDGQVVEKFTLEACEDLLRGYGYTIEENEEAEAREYEGGKEDYLYDNYVADQLESEDK